MIKKILAQLSNEFTEVDKLQFAGKYHLWFYLNKLAYYGLIKVSKDSNFARLKQAPSKEPEPQPTLF